MGRHKAANPRDVPVCVRLTTAEAAVVDARRGGLTRAAYFVHLLRGVLIAESVDVSPLR